MKIGIDRGALLAATLLAACQTVSESPATEVDAGEWMTAKAGIYRELALRSLRSGDHDRTRQLLAEAVQFEAGDVHSLELLARLSLASGSLMEAKSYARWWLELEPDSAPALCLNGIIDESLGNLVEAEEFFRRATALDAADPRPLIDLHTFLLNRGREVEATAVRTDARRRFPDRCEVLLDYGAYLESRGRWREALMVFQEARAERPDDLDLAVRVGTAALLGGREEVLVDLERELPPHARLQDPSLVLLLAALRLRGGDDQGVLEELDFLEGTARDDPILWLLRGEILAGRRDLAGAEAAFREALDRDDSLARAHGGLARVHLERGQHDAAGRALEHAVELEPRNAVHRALLAACLVQVGDLDKAREHFEVARSSGAAPDLVRDVERRFPELVSSPPQAGGREHGG